MGAGRLAAAMSGPGTIIWTMAPKDRQLQALPVGYAAALTEIKAAVASARVRARMAVNTELIGLYWQIGSVIVARQEAEGWGAKVIGRLADDLRAEFPNTRGFSRSNLHYMRRFAAEYPAQEVVQQAVGQLPWGHVTTLLDKLDEAEGRDWYAERAVANGWSRAVLVEQISSDLRGRVGAAPSNFGARLPAVDSDLAQDLVRDPYHLGFLGLAAEARERDLELALMAQLERFLLELGNGFAFVGRQVRFEVGGDTFFIDLLFYNYTQHRFVVVELKVGRFDSSYLGQLNLYVQWVDRELRSDGDGATVGLLLCASRNDVVVELALSGMAAPMAVADWKSLPADDPRSTPEVEAVIGAVEDPHRGVQLTLHDFIAERAAQDAGPLPDGS